MSERVRIKTSRGDVLFELTADDLDVYTGYVGGGRVTRAKAKKLRRLLKKYLTQP
jgi:hypothetical protein